MLRVFVQLMGGTAERAATVFLALETQTAKTQAINTVASSLPGAHKEMLQALLAIARTNQKGRDRFAHWIWGDISDLPDALLLLDPRIILRTGNIEFEDVYIYDEKDFVDIIEANDRLCGFGLLFSFILQGHPGNQGGQLLT